MHWPAAMPRARPISTPRCWRRTAATSPRSAGLRAATCAPGRLSRQSRRWLWCRKPSATIPRLPPRARRSSSASKPMNAVYQGPGDLADVIPVFPLPGALLLPRGQMPLNIFEPRYLAMIDDALRGHRLIGMIQPDAANPGPENKPNLYKVGCVGRITQLAETGDGRYLLQLTGIARFRIDEELRVSTPYR